MKKYRCPKCLAVVWSGKKLEYCICGGKYRTYREIVEELFKAANEYGL
ncbi:hypothetical protein LCGC14_1084190 [marine sediment metagenome]|uniref:Threonine synthase N-terminal domain-containing protein n=1 Tax=marine sediment metagenome TaxID=412755 RepID=A0A0F9PXM9_9ZZZZ